MRKTLFLFIIAWVALSFVSPSTSFAQTSTQNKTAKTSCSADFTPETLGAKGFLPSGNVTVHIRIDGINGYDVLEHKSRLRAEVVTGLPNNSYCEPDTISPLSTSSLIAHFDCVLQGVNASYQGNVTLWENVYFYELWKKSWEGDQLVCQDAISFPVSTEAFQKKSGSNTRCPAGGTQTGGVSTALGCIPVTKLGDFATSLLQISVGFAGGIALILIIVAGYTIATSTGNPERLKEGQERLTSAIMGVLFIALSLALLEIIGAGILKIPGITY